jgi:hypothetical protein
MFYYYLLNGLELSVFLLPVYIENKSIIFCYMGTLYYVLNTSIPYYYNEIKNRLKMYSK